MDSFAGLNEAQAAAVKSEAKVLQVLAPPGSGKTKTLTTRVAHLISERGLQPSNIIVCTFTIKAAREMKERLRSFVGHELQKKLVLGTFHSVALRYLRAYGHHIGLDANFGIADTTDSKAILRRIIERHQMGDIGMKESPLLSKISALKMKGFTSQTFALSEQAKRQRQLAQTFAEYQAALDVSKLLDFDDILSQCCLLLERHAPCVSNVQAVLIDEFQDTNIIQYKLMGLLAQKLNVITIVGDPDQSIYGFRAAEIANLERMRNQWPDTITVNLEENYRSSGAILHAAQNIIEQDKSRPPKKLQATHSHGPRPVLRQLPSAAIEAEWIVAEIKRAQSLTGNMLKHCDFAILLRSSVLSRPIETAIGKSGIPYRFVGGLKFYDRVEVKIVVDYLRVIHQPGQNEPLERIINVPARKVGDVTIKNLQEQAQANNISLWKLILDATQGRRPALVVGPARNGLAELVNVILTARKRLKGEADTSVVEIIELVLQKIKLEEYLKKKYELNWENKWANVQELIAQAAELTAPDMLDQIAEEEELPIIDNFEQCPKHENDVLSRFLNNIALTSSADHKTDESGQPEQHVTISTIHAAKGLEWPVVFIPACYHGSIPHSRAEDHNEERRLLYVGITRAQALLNLSVPLEDTRKSITRPSSFLAQSGVSKYFDQRGPAINQAVVQSLSTLLHRDAPSSSAIAQACVSLENEKDDYWPVDGSEPVRPARWRLGKENYGIQRNGEEYYGVRGNGKEHYGIQRNGKGHYELQSNGKGHYELQSNGKEVHGNWRTGKEFTDSQMGGNELNHTWRNGTRTDLNRMNGGQTNDTWRKGITMNARANFSTASATLHPGFKSAAACYSKQLARHGEKASSRKTHDLAEGKGKTVLSFNSLKRPIEGGESRTNTGNAVTKRLKLPIHQEISRVASPEQADQTSANLPNNEIRASSASMLRSTSPQHRPRTEPMKRPAIEDTASPAPASDSHYTFISSSPAPAKRTTPEISNDDSKRSIDEKAQGCYRTSKQKLKPATTFHTTSIQCVTAERKTLGVRRSLRGWEERNTRKQR